MHAFHRLYASRPEDIDVTNRSLIPKATLAHMVAPTKADGVIVTITLPDGTKVEVAPLAPVNFDPFDSVDMKA